MRLSWSQPLPAAAAQWLVQQSGWSGEGPLDLRTWMVIVPTRQSSRRLRETLAVLAAKQGQAVFSPRVILPEQVPSTLARLPPVASRLQSLLAWIQVLLTVDLDGFRQVLPIDPPQRDFRWASGMATRLQRVQGELAEEGLTMAEVAACGAQPETERWQQLAQLESAWADRLESAGLRSRVRAECAGRGGPLNLPPGCERVALIGVPDPLGIAISYLEELGVSAAVDVLVYAGDDPNWAADFDSWGRPRPEAWSGRELPWRDFPRQARLAANPAQQADRIAEIATAHERPDEWLAVAVVDAEVRAPLEQALHERSLKTFNPEGQSWRRGPLHALLGSLATLVEEPTQAAVGALLRQPDILRELIHQADAEDASPATLLRQWDRLLDEHLAADLDEALRHAGKWALLQKALQHLATWRNRLLAGEFAQTAIDLLAEIFATQAMPSGGPAADAARHWVEAVEAVEAASALWPDASPAERWRLAVQVFGDGARFEPKPAEALELGGWLELLWTDAERVVIAGVNEGLLPESVVGDAFLPESLRVALGLRTNEQRLARDAYLLSAVMGSRAGEHVELLVGKTSSSGEPLRPSRLLLAGNDAALPDRVRHLFRPLDAKQANLPWRRAWRLKPPVIAPPTAVSVTALRDWLECPFRFFLRRMMRMESRDLQKAELDARDFGTLVHAALQAMGEAPGLCDSRDEATLRDGLLEVLDREARQRFGDRPSLPLVIQLESARQRLRRVAAIEAAERLAGWHTERVEWEFEVPLGPLRVKGKIDRIDRHDDGRVRVIDYKTSDKPVTPLEAHIDTLREDDAARPDWLRVEVAGKMRRWVDLQLPLYRRALAPEFGTALSCAYFNLPKAVGETGLLEWPDDQPELQHAAERCAEGVAAAIGAGDFWPPVEKLGRGDEDWLTLFHQGVAASVTVNGWEDAR